MYDVSGGRSGADVFATTTRELAEYISSMNKGSGQLLTAMDPDTLTFEVLVDPSMTPPPGGADLVMICNLEDQPQAVFWQDGAERGGNKTSLHDGAQPVPKLFMIRSSYQLHGMQSTQQVTSWVYCV